MSKSRELLDPICEWNRIVKEQGLYSDADLLKGVKDMATTIKTLQWDDDGNDLVRDIETNEVLEVNWSNEKMREYINENEEHIKQITAKNLKLKRKIKKLKVKLMRHEDWLL